MENTHDVIIELIQKETFKQEPQDLFSSSQVNQNSKLATLNPKLDNNIIKVGGRLKNIIDIPNNLKHQIILPRHHPVILLRHHPVTGLSILNYHKSNHHCGRDQALALLRERYWIVKAKSIIRKVLSTCLLCKHSRSMPKPQLMGNLPKEKIALFKPPTQESIILDLTTRTAVHLELSVGMTTDSFLMTSQQFIARKG